MEHKPVGDVDSLGRQLYEGIVNIYIIAQKLYEGIVSIHNIAQALSKLGLDLATLKPVTLDLVQDERFKYMYILTELSPVHTKLRFNNPHARRQVYTIRRWMKKYVGLPRMTVLATKAYSRLVVSAVVSGNKIVIVDVRPDFLPFPPTEKTVKDMLSAVMRELRYVCSRIIDGCEGIMVDPELPFDIGRYVSLEFRK